MNDLIAMAKVQSQEWGQFYASFTEKQLVQYMGLL